MALVYRLGGPWRRTVIVSHRSPADVPLDPHSTQSQLDQLIALLRAEQEIAVILQIQMARVPCRHEIAR